MLSRDLRDVSAVALSSGSCMHTLTHAHTPPTARRTPVSRTHRARTAHAPRTHRARRLVTRIAKIKIWRHESLRSLELAAEDPNGPPSDACLAAVLSQFDYQANEVQREHPKVKVQGVRHVPGRPARVRLQQLDLLHRAQRRVPEPCGRSGGGVSGGGVTAAA